MRTALTTRYPTRISSTTYLKLARYRFSAQHVLRMKVHDASERTCRTDTWHVRRLITWAKSVRKHIKGHLETCHVGGDSICAHGNKISAGVPLAITKEMAVGGLTAEALRCLGSYDPLISHAHGHAKWPAIRSLNSAREAVSLFGSCPRG